MSARLLRAAAAAALLPLGACSWFTDFKRTPVVYPWESASDSVPPRANPHFSVPVQGSLAPAYAVSYRAFPDSFAMLANPVAADARSLENGRRLYQINCAVCHGPNGMGNGPATRYGVVPIPINTDLTRGRTDGYIWGIIRNGRGAMPSYNRIEEMERWDVVNYLRAIQGQVAGQRVDTLPAGLPGETGATLPRASELGPTRPAPYFKHTGMQAGVRRTATPATGIQPSVLPDSTAGATTAAQPDSARPDTTQNRGRQP